MTARLAAVRRKPMTLDGWVTLKRANDAGETNGAAKRGRRDSLLAAATITALTCPLPLVLFDDDSATGHAASNVDDSDANRVVRKDREFVRNTTDAASGAVALDDNCALVDRDNEHAGGASAQASIVCASASPPTDRVATLPPLRRSVGWGPASLLLLAKQTRDRAQSANVQCAVERRAETSGCSVDDHLSSKSNSASDCASSAADQDDERVDSADQANDDDSADQAEDDERSEQANNNDERLDDAKANNNNERPGGAKEAATTTTASLSTAAAQDDARLLALLARRASTVQRACEHAVRVVRHQQRQCERQCALDNIRRALDLLTHTARHARFDDV